MPDPYAGCSLDGVVDPADALVVPDHVVVVQTDLAELQDWLPNAPDPGRFLPNPFAAGPEVKAARKNTAPAPWAEAVSLTAVAWILNTQTNG